jgi:hypothetical protein
MTPRINRSLPVDHVKNHKPARTSGSPKSHTHDLKGRGKYDRFVKSSLSFEENVSLSVRVAVALELGLTDNKAELIALCKRAGTNGAMLAKRLEAL